MLQFQVRNCYLDKGMNSTNGYYFRDKIAYLLRVSNKCTIGLANPKQRNKTRRQGNDCGKTTITKFSFFFSWVNLEPNAERPQFFLSFISYVFLSFLFSMITNKIKIHIPHSPSESLVGKKYHVNNSINYPETIDHQEKQQQKLQWIYIIDCMFGLTPSLAELQYATVILTEATI